MSNDLYSLSSNNSGSPIIAAGAVMFAFTMHCDVVYAAQTLLLHPSHLKPVTKETTDLTVSIKGVTISTEATCQHWSRTNQVFLMLSLDGENRDSIDV